ncbi:MAG: hypothetical protein J6Q22_19450 [Prevotella sp.]|nr:hypothetical protein [Prevotella sp.]
MKIPLMVKVYFQLRKGWKRLNKDAQQQVKQYLLSQRRANGYLNAGGQVDAYYTQFGKVLEAVLSPIKVLWLPKKPLVVKESIGRDTIYGQFFAFLSGEKYIVPQTADLRQLTSTAACCLLAMQHQTGEVLDTSLISWLKQRQDETGGFRASEVAPVPDLLSTAVALFTLRLIGERLQVGDRRSGMGLQSAARFIEAHWLNMGSFAPTLLDEYSDVEYLFYGLLALGSDE